MGAIKNTLKDLRKERDKLVVNMCRGDCANYASYRESVGQFKAFERAIQKMNDNTKNLEIDDDDLRDIDEDDEPEG